MAAVDTDTGPRTYGNWRAPASPGILGLGSVGTTILLAGLILVVMTLMVGGFAPALVLAAVLALAMGAVLSKDRHGRSVVARTGARAAWWSTRSKGTNVYRSGPSGRALWGTFQLPGILAPVRLSEHTDSYGRLFALVHVPATGSFAIVMAAEPDGASLVDPELVDGWVAEWGHWLAGLGDEPGVEAAAVTIETAPDTGSRLRLEVESNIDPDAPEFARSVLTEIVDSYPVGSSTVRAFVTVTFSAARQSGGRKRDAAEMGRDLASRLPGLSAGLSATGAGAARPVSAQQLCEVIRVAYDPAAASILDAAHAAGQTPELSWSDVGPSAAQASWGDYRHDSGFSRTWSMSQAPRGNVQCGVLGRLLSPHPDITRKRVTMVYRPIDPGRAAAIVESDLRAAEFRATSSTKPAAHDTLAVRSAAATASEEASGAGLVNFGMFVTATVTDAALMPEAVAAIDQLAATARVRLRPVYGSQDSAFAAALPLGLVIPKHLKVPVELRDKL